MTCPGEETINGFVQGVLTGSDAALMDAHLAQCAECRAVIAASVPEKVPTISANGDPTVSTRLELAVTGERGLGSGASPPVAAVLVPGQAVGRYVVENVIGAGGMGVVYAAQDPQLNRRVAVKVLRHEGRGDRQAALLREARAMAQLSHPNVVTVHDAGTFEGQVFLVMELVRGLTLRRWLKEQPRPWPEVLAAFVEAGRGLSAAHAVGIVHRDFKPDNVLIGADGRARVTDFGIARPIGQWEGPAQQTAVATSLDALAGTPTRTGAVKGTPAYMAPEQFRGLAADARTDAFSFGVALYEGLYGVRPFNALSPAALARGVLAGHLEPWPAAPEVPLDLVTALRRLLEADPALRYPTMDEALRELGGPLAASHPRSSEKRKGAGARRGLAVLTGAVLCAAAVFVVRAPSRAAPPPELSSPPEAVAQPPAAVAANPTPPAPQPAVDSPSIVPQPIAGSRRVTAAKRQRPPAGMSRRSSYDDSLLEPSFGKNGK